MGDQLPKLISFYDTLHSCYCPALKSTVYFTLLGRHHLLYKNRKPRSYSERVYRFGLLTTACAVITQATDARVRMLSQKKNIYAWNLTSSHSDDPKKLVRVVIIKHGYGKFQFLSIMNASKKPR